MIGDPKTATTAEVDLASLVHTETPSISRSSNSAISGNTRRNIDLPAESSPLDPPHQRAEQTGFPGPFAKAWSKRDIQTAPG